MTPFATFLYFGVLLYVLVPVLIARGFDVKPRRFILPATLAMVALQYGLGPRGLGIDPWNAIARPIGFAIAEWAVAAAFLRLRLSSKRRWVFYTAVALASLPLVWVKFLPGDADDAIAFVGMSFVTFRALDVVFGIQDGLVKELPAAEYFSYLLFFPAISAGPIDRFRRFRGDYTRPRTRTELWSDVDGAMERVFRGLLYTFIVARLIDRYWLTPAASQEGVLGTVSYMYAYSFYLFFDFAGYSAFAIGVGYLLGVHMPENFDRPFLSKNIIEFWTRWHITLSTWLRDHIYGRFVLAATSGGWFKDPGVAGTLGVVLAFGVMGFWHGVEARYICYGFYHALLVAGYGLLRHPNKSSSHGRMAVFAARVVTFHFVCFGFLIFSGRLF